MFQKKSKVSLLTFNSALSYGAVLQTYAMVKTLEALDCDVEIIDFRAPFLPPVPTRLWLLKAHYNFKRLRKEILFGNFRNRYLSNKTKAIYSPSRLKKVKFNADYFIVGSDQVWNPDVTKKYALNYFFDFVNGNKISYAASFGKGEWDFPEILTDSIRILLNDFKAISVRESEAIPMMKEKFNIAAEAVLDPTLLNPDFSEILKSYTPKQQIAAFKLQYDSAFLELVSDVQNKIGVPALAIDTQIEYKNITSISFPSVKDWIKHIAESSFIVTDSFHGVAFSLIFKKNFIVLNAHPKRFIRIQDLLTKLGLLDRIVKTRADIIENSNWMKPIDYLEVDKELSKLRGVSMNFLKTALNKQITP